MLGAKFGEHWALDDDEAKQVEAAIKRVMRHQDMQVSQRHVDYLFAGYVVAMVYGTRVMTSFVAKSTPDEPEPVSSAPIFPFPQSGPRPTG